MAPDFGLSEEEREQKEADGNLGERRAIDDYDSSVATVGVEPDYHETDSGYVGTDPIYQNYADDTHKPSGVVPPYDTNAPEGVLTAGEEYYDVEAYTPKDNVEDPKAAEKAAKKAAAQSKPADPQPAQ